MTHGSPFQTNELSFPFAKDVRIAIVTASWNHHITHVLRDGALATLKVLGLAADHITVIEVPGSFELALGAQWQAEQEAIDAVLCFGCVIQGDTPHFDYVCQAATDGILQVGLKYNKPVIFGVLTTNTEEQAWERAGGKHGHKGEEAALTAMQMLALKQWK